MPPPKKQSVWCHLFTLSGSCGDSGPVPCRHRSTALCGETSTPFTGVRSTLGLRRGTHRRAACQQCVASVLLLLIILHVGHNVQISPKLNYARQPWQDAWEHCVLYLFITHNHNIPFRIGYRQGMWALWYKWLWTISALVPAWWYKHKLPVLF